MSPRAQTRQRVLALVLLVALVVAVAASDAALGWLDPLLQRAAEVIDAHPRIGIAVFIGGSILSAMLAFFSSAIIVPVAIHAWGEGFTALLLWLSWLLGGMISYAIGRTLGRRVAGWLVPSEAIEHWSSKLSANAGFFTILLFQLALPSEVPGYVLGTLRYRALVYFGALAIGELPFALGTVYLGESFLERDFVLLVAIGIAGIALSALAFVYLQRRIEPTPTANEREDEG